MKNLFKFSWKILLNKFCTEGKCIAKTIAVKYLMKNNRKIIHERVMREIRTKIKYKCGR